jgi:hypothetical protein
MPSALHVISATALLCTHSFLDRSLNRQSAPVRAIAARPGSGFYAVAGSCIVIFKHVPDDSAGPDSWQSTTICARWMNWKKAQDPLQIQGCLPDEDDFCVSSIAR